MLNNLVLLATKATTFNAQLNMIRGLSALVLRADYRVYIIVTASRFEWLESPRRRLSWFLV